METNKLQNIINSDKNLTIKEVQNILYELKQDCFDEISKGLNKDKEQWYYGETNAFFICLDLLEKVEQEQENQALKDRWDRLEQFVWEQLNNENFDKYKAYDEVLSKMRELEKEIK